MGNEDITKPLGSLCGMIKLTAFYLEESTRGRPTSPSDLTVLSLQLSQD